MGVWKFEKPAQRFHDAIDEMLALNPSPKDLIHQNPLYAGAATIARWLFFYEVYKLTAHLAGHYAEVGTDKGTSLLYFAKLFELMEPHSFTECHGFDWFGGKGMEPSVTDVALHKGSYAADEASLRKLIDIQNLGHVAKVHRMDATTEQAPWFKANALPLKIALMDAGTINDQCLPVLWENLVPGGILILDHFGDQRVPGEVHAARKHLAGVEIRQFHFSRHPSAYAVKG